MLSGSTRGYSELDCGDRGLEASLATAADTRHRFLDALLAEVLAPDAKRQLEAAE